MRAINGTWMVEAATTRERMIKRHFIILRFPDSMSRMMLWCNVGFHGTVLFNRSQYFCAEMQPRLQYTLQQRHATIFLQKPCIGPHYALQSRTASALQIE